MNIIVHELRNIDELTETDLAFFREFTAHIPIQYRSLVQNLIRDPMGDLCPSITKFALYYEAIKSKVPAASAAYISANYYKFLSLFIKDTKTVIKPCSIILPEYNLYHHGNICHLNVCINILSSFYQVINKLFTIDPPSYELKVIRQYLANSLSPVDVNPRRILQLIDILNININDFDECEETFKQLMKILYQVIDRETLLYWDTTDTFIEQEDKKLNIHELIDKYHPKYLVVNAQDFNTINDASSNSNITETFSTDNYSYTLMSIAIGLPGHFISAFRHDASRNFVIRDDLKHRYCNTFINIDNIRNTVCLECYVRN